MTDHPITPPPELVQQWVAEIWHEGTSVQVAQSDLHIATRAAQWGADQRGEVNEAQLQQARDQELEACCEWLESEPDPGHVDLLRSCATALRAARRPKPSSLKEQALKTLEDAPGPDYPRAMTVLNADQHALIRRALEALPDD